MQGEVQCTRRSVRRIFWTRQPGDTAGLVLAAEEEEIADLTKDWVARPVPVVELDQKLINAKSHVGAVLQMSLDDGSIITDWRLYALLINNMVCNTAWIIVGENNKDGIFHTHVIARTHVRTDSWRRTCEAVWKTIKDHPETQRQWGVITLDCLKSQKAHKTSALLEYMCKDPIWICSNSDPLLQMSVDIETWELAARFKAPIPETPDIDRANPLVAELIQCIQEHDCKSVEDVMKYNPDVVIKYLHRPGIQAIISNCLTFCKCTAGTWNIKSYGRYPLDPSGIHGCLLSQGIIPSSFDPIFHAWITKQHGKKNTICLYGPSNTGKSSFIAGFGKCCPGGEIVNGPNFNFEGLIDHVWGKWEEPLIPYEVVEKFKQIAEGMETNIPVKFKKPFRLPRTPIFMTTNNWPWYWCANAEGPLRNRMWIFEFNYDMTSGVFVPRCIEPSCKCSYCEISRSGASDSSSSATGGLQEPEQSVSEQLVSGGSSSEFSMGTGPLSRITGGSEPVAGTSSSGGESSSYSAAGGSSSASTSSSIGSGTESGSSYSSERIRDSNGRGKQPVGTSRSRGSDQDDNRGNGGSSNRGRGYGKSTDHVLSRTAMVSMGGTKNKKPQMEVHVQPKKQRLDGKMVTMITKPDKEEWARYLSYIYHRFETKYQVSTIPDESILRCEETLSDSE